MFPEKTTRKSRQSGIELLRIIAMYLIVSHHMVTHNAFDFLGQDDSVRKVILSLFEYAPGKIGIALFFIASAWFLSNGAQTLEKSCRRLWTLEKELLFWSVLGLVLQLALGPSPATFQDYVTALFPVTTHLWWYITSYALFIIVLPFLMTGLRSLGKRRHKQLVLCLVAVWGVLYLIPYSNLDIGLNLTGFVYTSILVSYYRWYLPPANVRLLATVCIASGILILAWNVILELLYTSEFNDLYCTLLLIVDGEWSLPVLAFSFSVFLLFTRLRFHSRLVNSVASLTLGVYLITDHPVVRTLLWQDWFDFGRFYGHRFPIAYMFIIVTGVFVVALLMEQIRQCLFRYLVDSWWNACFDRLWSRTAAISSSR